MAAELRSATLRTGSHRAVDDLPRADGASPDRLNPWAVFATILALMLFFAGFVLGLDPGGGTRSDLYIYHLPTIYAFHTRPWLQVLRNYPSATTPLYHMLQSFNPLLGNDTAFRASNLIFSLVVYSLYMIALRKRFADAPQVRSWAALLGAALVLSPYFQGQTYWPITDTLPLFFVLVVFLLFDPIENGSTQHKKMLHPGFRMLLLAVLSVCAFYTRQSYLFLPLYVFILLCKTQHVSRWWTLLAFALAGLPSLYLFWLWRGFTPPSSQRINQGSSAEIIVYPLTMIAFYAIPLLFEELYQKRGKWSTLMPSRTGWLALIIGAMAFLLAFRHFSFSTHHYGGGIASKIFAKCGRPGPALFLLFAYVGLLILIWLFRVTDWKTRTLLLFFLLPTFMMKVVFERYYDPLLYMLFFLFFDRDLVRRFVNVRTGILIFLFMGALLGGALRYHAQDSPNFPLYGKQKPWGRADPTGGAGLPYR
jgi:hypothetical protein